MILWYLAAFTSPSALGASHAALKWSLVGRAIDIGRVRSQPWERDYQITLDDEREQIVQPGKWVRLSIWCLCDCGFGRNHGRVTCANVIAGEEETQAASGAAIVVDKIGARTGLGVSGGAAADPSTCTNMSTNNTTAGSQGGSMCRSESKWQWGCTGYGCCNRGCDWGYNSRSNCSCDGGSEWDYENECLFKCLFDGIYRAEYVDGRGGEWVFLIDCNFECVHGHESRCGWLHGKQCLCCYSQWCPRGH